MWAPQRLERQFGLCGTVLQWIQSYLSDRTFRVVYGDVLSVVVYVMCSVPQGSVLGPLFFILYMADLADRAVKFGESLHAYADDTQLYLHFRRDEMASSADQHLAVNIHKDCSNFNVYNFNILHWATTAKDRA